MAIFNPKTAMAETEKAYPALVNAYRELTKKIGILHPAVLVVTEGYDHGHAFARFQPLRYGVGYVGVTNDHIGIAKDIAALGDSAITRGILGHETGHLLTRKTVTNLELRLHPVKAILKQRGIEREADRIGAIITGAKDMLAARHWVLHEGLNLGRASNNLQSSTILGACNKQLARFMEDINYTTQFGKPRSAEKNIVDAAGGNHGFVKRLVEKYNNAAEAELKR